MTKLQSLASSMQSIDFQDVRLRFKPQIRYLLMYKMNTHTVYSWSEKQDHEYDLVLGLHGSIMYGCKMQKCQPYLISCYIKKYRFNDGSFIYNRQTSATMILILKCLDFLNLGKQSRFLPQRI